MRIEKIKLQGFKDINRVVEVDFSKEDISILYGENGCGKTSLIRVINAILAQNEQELIKENIKKVELQISSHGVIKEVVIEKVVMRVEKYSTDSESPSYEKFGKLNRNPYTYNWDEYLNSELCEASSILFGVNRGISIRTEIAPRQIELFFSRYSRIYNINKSDVYRIAEELSDYLNRNVAFSRRAYMRNRDANLEKRNSILEKLEMKTIEEILCERYRLANQMKIERVQNALFETLSDAIYSEQGGNKKIKDIPQDFVQSLSTNRAKLLEILRGTADNMLQRNIISILETKDIDKVVSECKKNVLLLNLLNKMMEELKKEESILESISTLENIFNEHIRNDKKLVVNEDGVLLKFKNEDNNHDLNGLSSGEKHLLSILTIFLIEGKNRDILMIDEPELSLNMRWQRKLLDTLKKVVPNTQIIVASHSSVLARGNTKYLVEMI